MATFDGRQRRMAFRARRHARGAVFVEALIVICTFTLFFMGIVFFREVYVRKIRTQSLARAGAIAYAMGACETNDPRTWLGKDLGRNSPVNETEPNHVGPESGEPPMYASDSEKGSRMLSSFSQTSDGTFLNPIARTVLTQSVKVTQQNGRTAKGSILSTTVSARSHQTCSDRVRDGDFSEVINEVKSFFK